MKVKTLLKTFERVNYVLQTKQGISLEEDFVGDSYDGSMYDDYKVVRIRTVSDIDTIYITISEA